MLETTTSRTTLTLLLLLLLLFTVFSSSYAVINYSGGTSANWSAFYASGVLVAGFLLASALVVVAARVTLLAWITVLVLLAFAGKRRKVLVQQGRKITTDAVVYFFKG